MSERKDKFIKRNTKHMDELTSLVSEHGKNIRCLIVSSEMVHLGEYFELYPNMFEPRDIHDHVFWEISGKKLVVLINPYQPADVISVVLKDDNKVKFDVPCVCGIYSDEPHTTLK
jgi:hypothetical protein